MNSTVLVFGGVWVEAQIRFLMLRVQGFGFVEFVGCDSSLALMDFFYFLRGVPVHPLL